MPTDLSPEFFDLQLRFAEQVVRVSGLSMEEALLDFTNIYIQCLYLPFDAHHPSWQMYLEGLQQVEDKVGWTYTFYRSRVPFVGPPAFGCFRYGYLADEQTIRLHFAPADSSGYGPLSRERMTARLQELQMLFADVKRQHPEAQKVRGASWLYNLAAYRRLFPSQYTDEMERREDEFRFLALWGQFVRRDGRLREPEVSDFLSCCSRQQTLEGLARCFPYDVLVPSCSISAFYEFYEGITF